MSDELDKSLTGAKKVHEDYIQEIRKHQEECSELGGRYTLWNTVFRAINYSDATTFGEGPVRDSVGFPRAILIGGEWSEGWPIEDWVRGEMGGKMEYTMIKEHGDDPEDWPSFISDGQDIRNKKLEYERTAEDLYNIITSDEFREEFADLDYRSQVETAAQLTTQLDKSEYGLRILRAALVTRGSDGEPFADDVHENYEQPTFPALQLLDPWGVDVVNFSDGEENTSQGVKVDGGEYEITDVEFGESLSLLCSNIAPALVVEPVNNDLVSAQQKLQEMLATFSDTFDDTEFSGICDPELDPTDLFEDATDRYGGLMDAIDDINEATDEAFDGEGTYQLASELSSLLTITTVTISAIEAAADDDFEIDAESSMDFVDDLEDLSDVLQSVEEGLGAEYEGLKFVDDKNGRRLRKTSYAPEPSAARTAVSTTLSKCGTVTDILSVALVARDGLEEEDPLEVAWAGVGAGIIVGSLFGKKAVLGSLALMAWDYTHGVLFGDEDALEDAVKYSYYGIEDDDIDTTDPSTQFFGYDTYEMDQPTGGQTTMSGIARQISQIRMHTKGFSAPDEVVLKTGGDRGDGYCELSIDNIRGADTRSAFFLRTIQKENGAYTVSPFLYRVNLVRSHSLEDQWDTYGKYETFEAMSREVPNTDNPVSVEVTGFENEGSGQVRDPKEQITSVDIRLNHDDDPSYIFGLDDISSDDPPYVELMLAPATMPADLQREANKMEMSPGEDMLDAMMDQQGYPRTRLKITRD